MNNKQIEPIIKATGKALTPLHEVKPLKPKMKRAKPLKYDTGEKNWSKQIDDILSGEDKTKDKKGGDKEWKKKKSPFH